MAKVKDGWRRVRFEEVVRLNTESSRNPEADGISRYVGLEHLEPGDTTVRSWGDVADGTTFTNRFRPGHVLFGKRRAYQRKVAVADFEGVCSGDIYVFETADPDILLPELLPFVCQTDAFFEHAVGTSAGSLSPRTNWRSLADYEFLLPPLKEQAPLARLFRRLSDVHSAHVEAVAAGRTLFARLALDLTLPKGSALSPDNTISDVPKGWRIVRVSELCERRADLVIGPFGSNLKRDDYEGRASGVPVIFVRDIRPNQFQYLSDCYVDEVKAKELAAHQASAGDVLVTKVGVPETKGIPPGLAAVLPDEMPDSVVTADVVRARVSSARVLPKYFAYLLNSEWGRQQTWRISPGSTTRFKMTLAKFAAIRLPLPPLECQREVVDDLDSLRLGIAMAEERKAETARLLSVALTSRLGL